MATCQALLEAMVKRKEMTILVPYPVLAERLLAGRDGIRTIERAMELMSFAARSALVAPTVGAPRIQTQPPHQVP